MDASARPLVVAVGGDPGGANAVAPVLEMLRAEERVAVQALAYRQARTLWARRNLAFEELPEDLAHADGASLWRYPGAALLLTGTSVNGVDLEKQFVAAARRSGVPSLAVLDFWTNYAWRFGDARGRLVFLPDRIAVMDARARAEMIAEGFEPEQLVITGQPAFDDLPQWRSRFTPARRQAIREALGVRPGERVVLFASQPLTSLYGSDLASPSHPGYDERTVLRALVAALDQVAEQRGARIVLAVRPHPRERSESYEAIQSRAIRTVLARDGESRELVMAADLVAGMNTALLVEACYLACLTVSIQPGLRLPDGLPTNRWGTSRAVYHVEEIRPAVEQMLLDKETRQAARARLSSLVLDGGATRRVVELVYHLIGLEPVCGRGERYGETGH